MAMGGHPTPNSVGEAANAISGILDGAAETPAAEEAAAEESPQETPAPAEAEEAAQPDPAEASEAETPEGAEASDSETTEATPDTESVELPGTLDDFASAVGLERQDLDGLKVNVTVAGESQEVTLADAVRGYIAQADYSRKTADLADQRRQLEAQQQEAVNEWQRRFQEQSRTIQELEQALHGESRDLDKILADEGAEAYLAAKAQLEAKQARLKQAREQAEAARQAQSQQLQQAHQALMAQERQKLAQVLPDFANAEKGPKLVGRLKSYMEGQGFSEQEMGSVVMSHHITTIHKAMQWDELQKAKPKTVKQLKSLPKVTKPGAKPEKGEVESRKRGAKVQRLQKTGTAKDAADFFEGIL